VNSHGEGPSVTFVSEAASTLGRYIPGAARHRVFAQEFDESAVADTEQTGPFSVRLAVLQVC
jgi:hypothetical protein